MPETESVCTERPLSYGPWLFDGCVIGTQYIYRSLPDRQRDRIRADFPDAIISDIPAGIPYVVIHIPTPELGF